MFTPLRTFGFLLKDVRDLYRRRFELRASALGLTMSQCQVLLCLQNHQGINQVQLAALTDIEPMTLVRILDRMESDGWLRRHINPANCRAHCIHLQSKSKAVVDDIWSLADLTYRDAFAGVPREHAEFVVLLLEKVARNFALVEPTSVAEVVALPAGQVKAAARSRRARTISQS
jgi:MarR family transcriptional regulator for hemolysin